MSVNNLTETKGTTTTLYAKWIVEQNVITFNSNGGSIVNAIIENYNTSISAPTNPTRTGYSFAGWYSNSALTTAYTFSKMPAEDITLYAKMSLKSFHINFVKIGISTDGTRKTLATSAYLDWFDLAEDPRDLTRDIYNDKTYTIGYTFAGFFVDADLTTPITEVSNELDHDITIYAKETLDTYTITYYERGEITGTRTYTIETESIGLPNGSNFDNAYGHWIFRGWRLNNADTGEQFAFPTTIHPSADPEKFHGNLDFYAYYQEP